MKLAPGQMVTQTLRLVQPLGRGGMGEVWVAFHQTLGAEVAVKFVDPLVIRSNPAALVRFNREAGIAARLKNPHVAHTYDHGMLPGGAPYIVMELLEGESLHERIDRLGRLSLLNTSLVVSQTAQALGKAHKLGIVHRDIKPANLFCVESDYDIFIKLLDFGIAKHAGGLGDIELTSAAGMLGSPLYMSPEQFDNPKGVDWRGDLWSLAVVAYHCLTGRRPFNGEALAQVIIAVMDRNYPSVTSLVPELPPALNDWFDKAFHRSLGHRFQTAKELGLSFVAIARDAAEISVDRPALPTITGDINKRPSALFRTTRSIKPQSGETVDVPGRNTRTDVRAAAPAATNTVSLPVPTEHMPAPPAGAMPVEASPAGYGVAVASSGPGLSHANRPRANTQVMLDLVGPPQLEQTATLAPASSNVGPAASRRAVIGAAAVAGGMLVVGTLALAAAFSSDDGVSSDDRVSSDPAAAVNQPSTLETSAPKLVVEPDASDSASPPPSATASTSSTAQAATPPPPYAAPNRVPPRPQPPRPPPPPPADLGGAGF